MRAAALALSLALAGCAAGRSLSPSATLPAAARAAPERYLVVTVRNPLSPPPARAASTPRGYDAVGRYVAGGTALTASRSLASDYGLVEVSSWPIALLGVHCLVYGVPAGADAARLAARLERDRRVESVQSLQRFDTESGGYDDPYAPLQLNLAQMAIPEAHALSRGGGVRIAIIDTGADIVHPDLRPGATRSRNFVDGNAAEFRGDAHGTAVAGIIGAIPNNGVGIAGVAPEAELYVYKACWRAAATGTAAVCNSFTLAQALAAAIEAHADVINLSLGGPSDPLLTRLVNRALADGAIVVGAMPPDGVRRGFPVEIDGVIAADAAESGRTLPGVVRAPGREVLSLAPDGHYDFYSGSSFAAAEISGLVALLRAELPRLGARDALALLTGSEPGAAPAPNACAALAALTHRVGCGRKDERLVAAPRAGST